MPRRDCPIDEATIWDVIDWDTVAGLSVNAPHDKYGAVGRPDLAVAFAAKMLIDAGAASDAAADAILHKIVFPWCGNGDEATRRQRASGLARVLGADPVRFIEYATRKWGLFKSP